MGDWAESASGKGADKPTTEATLKPLGYEQITSLAASQSLTVPTGARLAVLICETQAVRWRDDGTDPTASVGMPLAVGVQFTYSGNLAEIEIIEQTASAKLNVSYYK